MARRHGSKRGSFYTYTPTANLRLLGPSLSSLVLNRPEATQLLDWDEGLEDLRTVQDRRRFDADPHKPARKTSGSKATFRALHNAPMQVIGFEHPKRVLICLRRKARREVLHALKKTGRGHGGGRKRRNAYSNVRC